MSKADPGIHTKTPIILPEDVTIDTLRSLSKDSFPMWCLSSGAKVDGHLVDFDSHRYLLSLYADTSDHIVLCKAAQVGASVFMLLKNLWFLEQNPGTKALIYFPTQEGAQNLSSDRLDPIIESCPTVAAIHDKGSKLSLRKFGESSLYILHLGGSASKDSVPGDMISFDEVRLVAPKDVDQALERIAHSTHKKKMFLSTMGNYGDSIHARFLRGKQYVFHSKCGCFVGTTNIVVKHKNEKNPKLMSFHELKDTWQDYQALSMGPNRALRYKNITAFHENGVRDVNTYAFRNGTKVTCTPDHVFFRQAKTLKNGKSTRGRIIEQPIGEVDLSNAYKNKVICVSKFPAEHLETGVGYDNDLLYTLGAYVAEGSWPNAKTIDIAQLQGKRIWWRVQRWARSNNLPVNTTGGKVVRISLASRPDLQQLFLSCGKGCENKMFPQRVVDEASEAQLYHLLQGYLNGDGHDESRRLVDTRGFQDNTQWSCATTSATLAAQIRYVALRLGTPVYESTSFPVGKKPTWSLQYNPKSTFASDLVSANISQVSIRSTTPAEAAEVYDITVEDDHNYVLESGMLVHNCSEGCDLAHTFPECIVEDKVRKQVYLRCPKCKYIIKDAQNGRYVAHNPQAEYNSYHISQLQSKFISTKEVWESFQTTTNIKEFYNAKLGRPYTDEANKGVSMEQLHACVNRDVAWPKGSKTRTAMGVDVGSTYLYVTIGDIHPDGSKKRLRHFEIIERHNPIYFKPNGAQQSPFVRLHELMKEFKVEMAVIDQMPETDAALAFAQTYPGRVFLCHYGSKGQKEVVIWHDRIKTPEGVKKAGAYKFKYFCTAQRFQTLGAVLADCRNGNWEFPNPDALIQRCRDENTGIIGPEQICHRLFDMMTRLIKEFKVSNIDTGEGTWDYIYVGNDPHGMHALSYMNLGLERLRRQPIFTFA